MNIIKTFALVLIVLASSQSIKAELIDRIVAVVNDDIILQSEFQSEMGIVLRRLQAQQEQLPSRSQIAQQVLEQLIVKKIQSQRARNAGLRIPDQMINEALMNIARSNGTSLNELPAALAADGVDYASFREEIREQLTIQQLSQRELGSSIRVSDSEVERLIAQGNSDQEYLIKHILIAVDEDAPAELIEQKNKEIKTLRERIANGESFSKLAIAYSDGNKSLEGGNLGWRTLAKVPSIFSDKIRQLEPLQVSEIIKSPSGFHIVQVEKTRGNELPSQFIDQYSVRHILVRDTDMTSDSENKIKLNKIREQIQAGTEFREAARLHSEDPGSATKGGELGWSVPDIYDANFAAVIKSSEVGVISEPFKSQYGWHILEVIDKKQKDMAEDMLKNQARNALREQKFEEESLLWMQRLRDEAYVEYRL
jgi:peptidyl-prolyl cis-trans isomerase SurA